ncbi:MAG: hypothetical protein IKD18_05160 [Clostridia bacterium]|nr:hypothetical protein [Clostridia bacterium]
MTKRLMCLVLALIMLFSLCMTACSETEEEGEEKVQAEVQRKNLALTIYAVTDEKTTDEALAAVEKKVSEHCIAKYKTAIDLRFFTEAEYQKALNDMYDKFAAEEAAKKKAEAEKAAAEASIMVYKNSLSKEERIKFEQKQREEAKKAEEEAKKKAEEEAELIEMGKDVATVKDVQMDIIYIPDMEHYYSWIEQGLLQDINNYLIGKFKRINDYVFPSYLTAATVGTGVYGIPNNQGITTNETFLLVRSDLAAKYNVDLTKVRSVTDLEAAYTQVVANEPGVGAFYGDWVPEGVVYDPSIDMAHAAGVFYDTLVGGKFTATNASSALNPNSSYGTAFVDYCATKAAYRKAGYLSDNAESFFATVKELTPAEKAEWEAKGYTAVLYKGADFNTAAALNVGLYGLSKHCTEPERAMEVLQLMYTDPELHNLLAYGLEDVHYTKVSDAKDDPMITIIDDSYSMDAFRVGNALLGYIPDNMDPNSIEVAKQKNLNSHMNAFLGFRYDWTAEKEEKWLKLFQEWKTYLDPLYQQVCYGTDDYFTILENAYAEIYKNPNGLFSDSYSNWQSNCSWRNDYKTYISKIQKLDKVLHFEAIEDTPAAEAVPAA